MVWLISMHRLTAGHLYHSLNASQEHLLLLPPGSFGSFCFVRVPASLGPTNPCVLLVFCPGFSGIAFVLLGSLILWFPPPYCVFCVFLCFTVPASLGQSSLILTYLDPFPSFFEMHGLVDFDAPLDSGAFISLVECITRALAFAASRLLWELLFC